MHDLKENFSWMSPEFKIVDSGKNTIRIKGVALRSNVVSKNNRKYVDEELRRAARTWIGKPITINHAPYDKNDPDYDPKKVVGNLTWMEYENGRLEYMGDVKKQPYVQMIRDGSTDVRGVSIQASYLHNQCYRCGERFYDEQSFHDHMHNEHFVKTDLKHEPHGIVGDALSLVIAPEEPGYGDTTITVMETYNQPVSQLLSRVIDYHKERLKLSKKKVKEKKTKEAVKKPKNLPYQIREQNEQPPACPEGEHRDSDSGECVPDEPSQASEQDEQPTACPDGEHRDPDSGECVPDTPNVEEQAEVPVVEPGLGASGAEGDPEKLACPENFHLETDDLGVQSCVADLPTPPIDLPVVGDVSEQEEQAEPQPAIPEQPSEAPCPMGQHKDPETGLCVSDTSTVTPPPEATEIRLPKLLRLGEPFAGYSSHDDCVAKNPDKDDADAYCADIMRKAEGETIKRHKESRDIYETLGIIDVGITETSQRSIIRDRKLAESVNTLNRAVGVENRNVKAVRKYIKEMLVFLNGATCKDRTQMHKLVTETRRNIQKAVKAADQSLKTLYEKVEKTDGTNTAKLNNHVAEYVTQKQAIAKQLGSLATGLAKQKQSTKNRLGTITSAFTKLAKKQQHTSNTLIEVNGTLKKELAETTTKLVELHNTLITIESKVEDVTEANEAIKEVKRKFSEYKKAKEQEDSDAPPSCPEGEHYDKEQEKCVPNEASELAKELKKVTETLAGLRVDQQNLEAKLKGNFKGKAKIIEGNSDSELGSKDPYDNPI